jgi:hypothetical protein
MNFLPWRGILGPQPNKVNAAAPHKDLETIIVRKK